MATVTLKRVGEKGSFSSSRYILLHSSLPKRSWAYGMQEMREELMVSCSMSAPEARSVLMEAFVNGEASREVCE